MRYKTRPDLSWRIGRLAVGLGICGLVACQPPAGTGSIPGPEPEAAPPPRAEPRPEPPPPSQPEVEEPAVAGPALERVPASLTPDLSGAARVDRDALVAALDRSLEWFAAASSREEFPQAGITHEWAWASVYAFRQLVLSSGDGQQLADLVRAEFDFFASRGGDGQGTVLFTGYYSPTFPGSRTQTGRYRYPVYRRPSDLVTDPATGEVEGRQLGDRIVPYPTRAEIETSGMLAGTELAWLSDPFDAYLIHIQGSAALYLEDGSVMQLGYAGNNGHEYVSVALQLVADGELTEEELSLDEVRAYFEAHPEAVDRYLRRNPRFIFFTETDGVGWPAGSLGVQLTPLHSLAADKGVFPPGGVTLIQTRMLGADGRQQPLERFMLDQDAGGAILTPGRADLYFGVGEEAERRAGGQYAQGRLYYLFLKPGRVSAWSEAMR